MSWQFQYTHNKHLNYIILSLSFFKMIAACSLFFDGAEMQLKIIWFNFLSPDISIDIICVNITCFGRAIRVSTITLPRQHSLSHFNVYYKLGKGQFGYKWISVCTNELDCTRLLVIWSWKPQRRHCVCILFARIRLCVYVSLFAAAVFKESGRREKVVLRSV